MANKLGRYEAVESSFFSPIRYERRSCIKTELPFSVEALEMRCPAANATIA